LDQNEAMVKIPVNFFKGLAEKFCQELATLADLKKTVGFCPERKKSK
jgi:hypothetical protein